MKLLALLLFLKVTHGFIFIRPSHQAFDSPFWKHFENSMKELETSFKTAGQDDSQDDTDDSDSDTSSTELMEEELPHDPFSMFPAFFGRPSSKPWWMGKNVCVTKEETDLGSENVPIFGNMHTHTESCSGGKGRYTCTSTDYSNGQTLQTTVKYECCFGHRLEGSSCKAVNLTSMADAVKNVAPEFSRMMETAGVLEKVDSMDGNFTMFVTGDEYLDDLREHFQEFNQLDLLVPARRRRDVMDASSVEVVEGRAEASQMSPAVNKVLLNHVVHSLIHTADMVNNRMVESLSGDKLRLNVYAGLNPTYTVNCKKIVKKDTMANKGLVHVVDGVLKPVERTVAQIIREDGRFSVFRKFLEDANLMDKLENDTVTVFAPTNEAFLAVQEDCSGAVARHHITPHVLCLSAMTENWGVSMLTGERIQLKRTAEGILINEKTKVSLTDIVGTNGVIHVVDEVLIPEAGRKLMDALEDRNLTTFKNLLKEFGMENKANVTWLVPRNDAFEVAEVKALLEKAREDPEKVKEILYFHSLPTQIDLPRLPNGDRLETHLNEKKLLFNMYSQEPMFMTSHPRATVNCARVRITDTKACGVKVHEIERLLIPPTGNAMEVIADLPQFSILNKIVKKSGMEAELQSLQPMTLLAPTDDAFNDLSVRTLNGLLDDEEKAKKMIENHIIPDSICCHGVSGQQWLWPHHVATRGGQRLQTRRDSFGHVHFGKTRVSECDRIATNGIIHTVNKVLMPKEDRHNPFSEYIMPNGGIKIPGKNPNIDLLLYGL